MGIRMDEREAYLLYRKVSRIVFPITLVVVLIAVSFLAVSYLQTGEFFERDISLAGGVTATFTTPDLIDTAVLEQEISAAISEQVRVRATAGATTQVVIEARIQDQERIDELTGFITDRFGIPYNDIGINFIGETLGASFFAETIIALLFAFALMAVVLLMIFRKWIVASYIIFAAAADIVLTVFAVNLLGMQVSTGGLAAFLMILGYSIDTDILLTTKLLKKQKEPVESRLSEALLTGLTMTGTSFIAVIIGAIVTNTPLIREIMLIIAIGLFFDVIITWFVNGHLVMRKLDAEVKRR
jgi:preprotein translocase subunit SecF